MILQESLTHAITLLLPQLGFVLGAAVAALPPCFCHTVMAGCRCE